MKAIVLAAGLGTRLRPLTAAVPKPLVPVLNRPVLAHVLSTLRAVGMEEIGVTIGVHCDPLVRYFGDGTDDGVRLTWLREQTVLGTGGSLRRHVEFFGGGPALVVTADMLSTLDLAAVVEHHREHTPTVTVAAAPVDLGTWGGDIVDPAGCSGTTYQFKPGRQARTDLGSAGTWVVHPEMLEALPPDEFIDFSADVLPTLPRGRCSIGIYVSRPIRLTDVGQFHTLREGNFQALAGRFGVVRPGVRITPDIWVEEDAIVSPTATLSGPVAVGGRVVIGDDAVIGGPCVIGPGVTVGAGAAVLSSLVLPGAAVPPGVVLADATYGDPRRLLHALMSQRGRPG